MTDTILGIRQDVLTRRLSGGSNNIKWSVKDAARIRQHIWELSEKNLLRAAEVKLLDSQRPAKAALLARFSPAGTITDEARDYFFAVDVSAPFDASSYKFPFCRAADGAIVASKIGWRQSFAALEKSNMSGIVFSEARSLVDHLEARLGEVKTAARRREARAFAAKVRSVIESIQNDPVQTREQRMAEARNFKHLAGRS